MKEAYKTRHMYLFLLVLVVCSGAAFQGWRTLLNNFAYEKAGLDGLGMGVLQSVREIPGLLSLLAVYLILIMREHRLAALSVLVLGAGVAMTGFLPSLTGIACSTLVMSFGFHYFSAMQQSLALQYFNRSEAPLVLGRLRSVGALVNLVVGAVIFFLAKFLGYTDMFALFGAVAVLAGLWGLTRDPSQTDIPVQKKKLVFKTKYWLFYILTFLSGSRRQIFTAFAVFLMVQKFHYSVRDITVLFIINNVVNYFVNPMLGRAVNSFGEHKILSLEYAALSVIFLGYAFTDTPLVAALLYIADNVVYNFSMAINTFYQKIADPGDIASGMVMGGTINHISAVIIPLIGGVVWLANYRLVFLGAVGIGVFSLIMVQLIPGQLKSDQSTC